MSIKKNRFTILLLDSILLAIFFIPLLFEKINKNKKIFDPHSILIIELWGIGDLVMMSSVIKPLRESYPRAKITLLSRKEGKVLFANNSHIDSFVIFDFPWTKFTTKYAFWGWNWRDLIRTITRLRNEKFDLALDARGDIRNNLLSFLSGAKRRIGYSWTGGKFFLTDALRCKPENLHRVVAWLSLLSYLGAHIEKAKPSILVSEEEEDHSGSFLVKNGIRNGELLVGIHPGAQIKSRCWPLDRFAELAKYLKNELKAKIIVFIEPEGYGEDIPLKEDFIKARLPLREMISIIKKLDLLVCNDSGAMHIGSAVNTRTLSIFGPGEIKKIGPYGTEHTLLFKENVECRPCFDYCRFEKAICLDNISVEMAVEATKKILKEKDHRS